jgi:integrase
MSSINCHLTKSMRKTTTATTTRPTMTKAGIMGDNNDVGIVPTITTRDNRIRHHHRRNEPVSEFVVNNFALDRKIKEACSGLKPSSQWALMEFDSDRDKELIADFIQQWSNEGDGVPMSPNTKRAYIDALLLLFRYVKENLNGSIYKPFAEMTKQDIVDGYLKSLKKELSKDEKQKWVNTYNTRAAKYLAFWKWLTQPELKREERQIPPQLKGLKFAKRKTKTSVRREDLWTDEEHKVFLERCEDPRLACFHAISLETGGRPSEILALKISDLHIRVSNKGKKYAEFTIGDKVGGKMRKPRLVNISDAIPYFNTWVSMHPLRDSPEGAYLFPSRDNRSKYRNKPLEEGSVRLAYVNIIEKQFPKLLESPDIGLEEKTTLKSLINDRKHYPYIRRHEHATKLVHQVSLFDFNRQMGHSATSNMYEVYVQDLGNESNRELLIAKGIIDRDETVSDAQKAIQPKYCPICHEANKQTADFCFRCNWIISKKGMLETRGKDEAVAREAEQNKQELQKMKTRSEEQDAKIQIMMANLVSLMEHLTGMKRGEGGAVELIPTTPPPELKIDEKGEKEFLFSAAEVARERFKERGGGNTATFSMRWKESLPTPPPAVEQ